MVNFILIEEKTEFEKVILYGKYMEKRREEKLRKSFRTLCLSLVPLCLRIGILLTLKR